MFHVLVTKLDGTEEARDFPSLQDALDWCLISFLHVAVESIDIRGEEYYRKMAEDHYRDLEEDNDGECEMLCLDCLDAIKEATRKNAMTECPQCGRVYSP